MSEKVPPRSRSRAAPFKPQASEVDKPYETDASQIAPPEPGPTISRGPALLDLKCSIFNLHAKQITLEIWKSFRSQKPRDIARGP